jgi:hypothetical protein
MRNVRAVRWESLLVMVMVFGCSNRAGARPEEGLTGVREKEGSALVILEGDDETLVRYEAVFPLGVSVATCECTFVARREAEGHWTLGGPDSPDTWSLRLGPERLVLRGSGAGCCGAGFPGEDAFAREPARPLRSCQVVSPRAHFFALDEASTRRGAYVVAGDRVQVYLPATEPELVPARFPGPRRSTVGLLRREALDCP